MPNVLFLYEVVTSIGVRGIKKQQKWIEYKFQISSTGCLHYSKLNGQVRIATLHKCTILIDFAVSKQRF